MEIISFRIPKTQHLILQKIIKKHNLSISQIINRCLLKYLNDDIVDDELLDLKKLQEDEDNFYLITSKLKMEIKKSSLIPNARKLIQEMKSKGTSATQLFKLKKILLERIKIMYGVESEEYQIFINSPENKK